MKLNIIELEKNTAISMYAINNNILYIAFEDYKFLQNAITRASEYFENKHFMGKYFTYEEFKSYYLIEKGLIGVEDSDQFTFGADWAGFNLSGKKMKLFWNVFDDAENNRKLTNTEIWLKTVINLFVGKLLKDTDIRNSDDWYLICTNGNCLEDFKEECELNEVDGLLGHELKHAFFYLDDEYYNDKIEKWENLTADKKDKIILAIDRMGGYNINNEMLVIDEAQAYNMF